MMRFNCPSCGATLSAPEEYAGRDTKCRRCNKPIVVPHPAATRLPSREAPDDVFTMRRTDPEELEELESEEQESLRRDHEPWFYGYLEKYARILQILGYVIAAGCAGLATLWLIVALVGGISTMRVSGGIGVMAVILSFLGWILGLVAIVAALLLWLVSVAAVLLAVDAARNIRAIKKATATAKLPK